MNTVNIGGFRRVTKRTAERLQAQGETVYMCGCKANPAGTMGALRVQQPLTDSYINAWTYYNARNETGYYPSFYIKEGK